jgi:dienelactone hydrolase
MIVRVVRRMAAVAVSVMLVACQSPGSDQSGSAATGMPYARVMPVVSAEDWSARGTVVANSDHPAFDLTSLPTGSSARTMVYRSISGISGAATEVSGAVFLPPGSPPDGGWPVIGYAHGTVGVTADCGPTSDPRLFGDIKAVAIQLAQGYAVVFTDYAGLGGNPALGADISPPAYLEPKSGAFNLIDAVRAARQLVPQLSSRWVALGASQGGETAWAVAEYNAAYGQGIDLLGAAAIVPTLDLSGLARRAQQGQLTVDELFLYPYVVTGLAGVDPSLQPDDYLHGALRDERDRLIACRGTSPAQKGQLAGRLSAADAKPSSPDAADRLEQRLAAYALPQQPTRVPILVVYGGSDDTVAPEWTEVAMGRACALGDTVQRVRMDGQGHTLDPGALLGQWVDDRFAGVPGSGNC